MLKVKIPCNQLAYRNFTAQLNNIVVRSEECQTLHGEENEKLKKIHCAKSWNNYRFIKENWKNFPLLEKSTFTSKLKVKNSSDEQ